MEGSFGMIPVYFLPNHICKGNETIFNIYDDLNESGFYMHGLFQFHKKAFDAQKYRIISFSAELKKNCIITVELELAQNRSPLPDGSYFYTASAAGKKGVHSYYISIDDFNIPYSCYARLQFLKKIRIVANDLVNVSNLALRYDYEIALFCEKQSMSVNENQIAEYFIDVANCSEEDIFLTFSTKNRGWETLKPEILPNHLLIPAGECHKILIKYKMSENIAYGGYEECEIRASWQKGSRLIKLVTGKKMMHPFLLVDKIELDNVRNKIWEGWRNKTFLYWKKIIDEWQVPDIAVNKDYLFISKNANMMRGSAILYALTGKEEYAEKVIDLLKKTIDPQKGYLHLPKFTSQELVHEGGCFANIALSYDLVFNHPLLSEKDHSMIRTVLEKFMQLIDVSLKKGEISNWTLYEATGALYCAAVLEDRVKMDRFLNGIGGIKEHLSKGILSDGWWYEASVGYNLLCASLFSEVAQVLKHFGINFKDENVPASYSKMVSSALPERDGLCYEIWGGNDICFRNIQMLWDSLLPFVDYRGVIFGINDSSETKIEGMARSLFDTRWDLAYYLYKKNEYGQFIKNLLPEERDLLFGLDFNENEEILHESMYKKSTYAKNSGAIVLRSQKENVAPREQLQIGLKCGSHGGAHGHYDRTAIISIMRYGKSLCNPMNIWYSYHTYMYKFYVQNSVAHNMVTVDLKQQDPSEPKINLFFSGKAIQACCMENKSRWCNPPYGGWKVDNDSTFAQRMWNEGRTIQIPSNPPEYSTRSGFTEEILSRRLVVVTDDYCIAFDYCKGEKPHNFNCFYHFQGLKGIYGNVEFIKHKERLSDDLLSSAQFITDCDVYKTQGSIRLSFETFFNESENNGNKWLCRNRTGFNDYGKISTNLFFLYPINAELSIAYPPEYQKVNKQLFYKVSADNKVLSEGKFGAWIFGRDEINVELNNPQFISLEVKVKDVDFEKGFPQISEKSVFWGNPIIICEDGTKIPLHQLPLTYKNVDCGNGIGIDYAGGPVKLQSKLYDKAIPAEPKNRSYESIITADLRNIKAVRFYAAIGGDYPVLSFEEEKSRRRTVSLSSVGKNSYFISILEPYENIPQIVSAKAISKSCAEVVLQNGNRQVITATGLEIGKPKIIFEEYCKDNLIRREETF